MEISFEGIPTDNVNDEVLNRLMLSNSVKQIDDKFFVIYKKQIIEFTVLKTGMYWINNVQKVPCSRYRLPEILPGMTQAQTTAVYIEKELLVRRVSLSRKNFDIYGKFETLRCG